jgi:hypothetical protein
MIRYIALIGVLVAVVISMSVTAVPAGSYSAPNRAKQHGKHARCSTGSKKHSRKDKHAARSAAKCRETRYTQSRNSSSTPSTSPPDTSPPDTTTTPSTPSAAPTNPPTTLTPPSCPPLKRPVGTAGTGIYGDIVVAGGPLFWTCAEQAGGEVQVLNSSGSVVASTTVAKGETFNLAVEPGTYRVVLAPYSSCEGPPVTVISGQETLVEITCNLA